MAKEQALLSDCLSGKSNESDESSDVFHILYRVDAIRRDIPGLILPVVGVSSLPRFH
jgi:hypothetical protein